jgi:hypothetical protein
VIYGALLAEGGKLLNDPDTLWHIAAGRWISAHHSVPKVDPFSFSVLGKPWTAHEWLSEWLIAALYDNFGWTGLILGAALAGAAAFAILAYGLLEYLPPKFALPALAVSFLVAAPHVTARPHLFAMPLLVLWVTGLARARAAERAPPLWLLPLMTLWANMHGGYIVGVGVCWALAAEAVLAAPSESRMKAARAWGSFAAGAMAASLLTPHGFAGWLFPFQFMSLDFSLNFVNEFHAPDFMRFQPMELWLAGFAVLMAIYRPSLSTIRILLTAGVVYMAAKHIRNAELLAFVIPPLLAAPLGRAIIQQPATAAPRVGLAPPILAICAILAASLGAALRGYDYDHPAIMPAQALAAAREANLKGPVFNDYDFGGYLIFAGVPVFVDGRADLYGDAFMRNYARAVGGDSDELARLFEQHRIAWTLLPPSEGAVKILDRMPGWQRIYADGNAVVHRRVN